MVFENDDRLSDASQGAEKKTIDVAATRPKPIITIEEADEVIDQENAMNGLQQPKIEREVSESRSNVPKFAITLDWNVNYFKTSVGLLRLLFMLCCSLSLVCLGNAGTEAVDVLELPAHSRIRFHIFSCVMVLLISALIYILEVTSLKKSMPVNWFLLDIFSSFILGILCIVSSTLILHANKLKYEEAEDNDQDGNGTDSDKEDDMPTWSNALLALAAVFGYFATLVSVFLVVFKCFSRKGATLTSKMPAHVQEEIMMTGNVQS